MGSFEKVRMLFNIEKKLEKNHFTPIIPNEFLLHCFFRIVERIEIHLRVDGDWKWLEILMAPLNESK